MLHAGWIRLAAQAFFAAVYLLLVLGTFLLHRDWHVHTSTDVCVSAAAIGLSSSEAITESRLASGWLLRMHHVRYYINDACRRYPRVEIGGWLTGEGIALDAQGACFTQHWCDDPLFVSADGWMHCRPAGVVAVGARIAANTHSVLGRVSHQSVFRVYVSTHNAMDRCVVVAAVCSARGYIEIPVVDPRTQLTETVLLELWTPPDGSAATAVYCDAHRLFRNPWTGGAWASALLGGANTTGSYRLAPQCIISGRISLSATAVYEMPRAPPAAVLNQTHALYRASAWRIGGQHLAVSIDGVPSNATFCIRWYFQPLAMRGALLAAVNGYVPVGNVSVSSSMCVQLPSMDATGTTILLRTDALPAAIGSRVGLGPMVSNASDWIVDLEDDPGNDLPYAYRLAMPHRLAFVVEQQLQPVAVYDTSGVVRALVPPLGLPAPPIRLTGGWLPACVASNHCGGRLVFADSAARPASLCYNLSSVTIDVPVAAASSSTLVHLLGAAVQSGSLPSVALVPPDATLYVLGSAADEVMSVVCNGNTYRLPASVPPTHCVPTAGPLNVGTISTVWRNVSGVLATAAFSDCSLNAYTSSYGTHIADGACVPMAPGTQLTFGNATVCAAADSASALAASASALSREISRQLGLVASVAPFLHAIA